MTMLQMAVQRLRGGTGANNGMSPGQLHRDHVDIITDIGGRMPAGRLYPYPPGAMHRAIEGGAVREASGPGAVAG